MAVRTMEKAPNRTSAAAKRPRRRKAGLSAEPELSLVVPLFNEAGSLTPFHEELMKVMAELGRPYEIIYIDDGSKDDTGALLDRLAQEAPQVRHVSLARNYGQSSAMQAGFDAARGDIIACLDGDQQNDPHDIARMLHTMAETDADIVSGWRRDRHDSPLRVLLSRWANRLISRLTGVPLHDHGCTLKLYRRRVLTNIRLYGEMHRFISVLLADSGAQIREIEVNHRARKFGTSKYRLDRTIRVVLDLVLVLFYTRYRQRPMHFFGTIGLAAVVPGLVICLYLLLVKLGGAPIGDRPLLLLGVMLVITGATFLGQGLLAELIVRLLHENEQYPQYRLRPVIDKDDKRSTK